MVQRPLRQINEPIDPAFHPLIRLLIRLVLSIGAGNNRPYVGELPLERESVRV